MLVLFYGRRWGEGALLRGKHHEVVGACSRLDSMVSMLGWFHVWQVKSWSFGPLMNRGTAESLKAPTGQVMVAQLLDHWSKKGQFEDMTVVH